MSRDRIWDAIVVGAGVAGLAAARVLRGAGARALVLEARDRLGGRVLTEHHPELGVPIELGAELVHGEAPRTLALVDGDSVPAAEIDDHHLELRGDRLEPRDDFFRVVHEVATSLRPGPRDRTVADAIEALGLEDERRALALEYVRGFHAADPERLSARAFVDAERAAGPVRRQLRFVRGYDGVVHALSRDLEPDAVRLGVRVSRIEWSRGEVRAHTADGIARARAAIVTVPAGVLLAERGEPGALAIEPRPRALDRALGAIEMGAACRVTLRLSRTIEELIERPRVAFVHTSDPDFPVWWTPYPLRAPTVVAWCGGPRAYEVSRDPIARATQALARWLGARAPRDLVIEGFTHDWISDPFARGAYSYVAVDGTRRAESLGHGIESTLWIAGEAWSEGEGGTVEGAIASGERAASQLARVLARGERAAHHAEG